MDDPKRIYELLLDYASNNTQVEALTIGLVWTACKTQHLGLAMSPGIATRTLPWPGTLAGKTLGELAGWVNDWEALQGNGSYGGNQLQLKPLSIAIWHYLDASR